MVEVIVTCLVEDSGQGVEEEGLGGGTGTYPVELGAGTEYEELLGGIG